MQLFFLGQLYQRISLQVFEIKNMNKNTLKTEDLEITRKLRIHATDPLRLLQMILYENKQKNTQGGG